MNGDAWTREFEDYGYPSNHSNSGEPYADESQSWYNWSEESQESGYYTEWTDQEETYDTGLYGRRYQHGPCPAYTRNYPRQPCNGVQPRAYYPPIRGGLYDPDFDPPRRIEYAGRRPVLRAPVPSRPTTFDPDRSDPEPRPPFQDQGFYYQREIPSERQMGPRPWTWYKGEEVPVRSAPHFSPHRRTLNHQRSGSDFRDTSPDIIGRIPSMGWVLRRVTQSQPLTPRFVRARNLPEEPPFTAPYHRSVQPRTEHKDNYLVPELLPQVIDIKLKEKTDLQSGFKSFDPPKETSGNQSPRDETTESNPPFHVQDPEGAGSSCSTILLDQRVQERVVQETANPHRENSVLHQTKKQPLGLNRDAIVPETTPTRRKRTIAATLRGMRIKGPSRTTSRTWANLSRRLLAQKDLPEFPGTGRPMPAVRKTISEAGSRSSKREEVASAPGSSNQAQEGTNESIQEEPITKKETSSLQDETTEDAIEEDGSSKPGETTDPMSEAEETSTISPSETELAEPTDTKETELNVDESSGRKEMSLTNCSSLVQSMEFSGGPGRKITQKMKEKSLVVQEFVQPDQEKLPFDSTRMTLLRPDPPYRVPGWKSDQEEKRISSRKSETGQQPVSHTNGWIERGRSHLTYKKENLAPILDRDRIPKRKPTGLPVDLQPNDVASSKRNRPAVGHLVSTISKTYSTPTFSESDRYFGLIQIPLLENSLERLTRILPKEDLFNFCIAHEGGVTGQLEPGLLPELLREVGGRMRFQVTYRFEGVTGPEVENQTKILRVLHDSPCRGHKKVNQTHRRIQKQYYQKSLRNDVQNHTQRGFISKERRINRNKTHQKWDLIAATIEAFDEGSIDTHETLKGASTDGQHALILQGDFTKYVIDGPSLDISALLSDRGKSFLSQLVDKLPSLHEIHQLTTSDYRSQTSGGLERHQTILMDAVRPVSERYSDWHQLISFTSCAYNTSVPSAEGFTFSELVRSRQAGFTRRLWPRGN